MRKTIVGIIASVYLLPSVQAQTWTAEQQVVLDVIDQTWSSIGSNSTSWIEDFAHENLVYWDWNNYSPRTRSELGGWEIFGINDGSEIAVVNVHPLAVAVQGSTAVVHYYTSLGIKNADGSQSNSERRCSDILINEGRGWKFFTWVCGPLPSRE